MSKRKGRDLNGILILDKPSGISSNAALQIVKRLYNAKKAGHTGSLDPLATGVLPICFGKSTKLSGKYLEADKAYTVIAKLGERTTTSDSEGEIVASKEVLCTKEQILSAIASFVGIQQQVPSMFSALKHNGQPLYKLARQGITVERKPREINIYEFDLVNLELPYITCHVKCSKGTYIRTLIDDLGELLGCGAHVTALNRVLAGEFKLENSHQLASLESMEPIDLDKLLSHQHS